MERSDDGLLAVGKGMRFFILIVALALSLISWPLSWAGDSSTNLNKDRYSSNDRVFVSVADSDQNKVPSAVETVRAMLLQGTDSADHILGYGSDDAISAGAGDDVVTAAAGADTVGGGDSNDVIYSGDGDDRLDGGTGNDYLQGDATGKRSRPCPRHKFKSN